MENASKALIMAGGILLGVLILALMATLFLSSNEVFTSYDETKKTEAVEQFNVNFTKYLGQELTIHEVVTLTNFANENNVKVTRGKNENQIQKDIVDINKLSKKRQYLGKKLEYIYILTISSYNKEGYISKISFSKRELKIIE